MNKYDENYKVVHGSTEPCDAKLLNKADVVLSVEKKLEIWVTNVDIILYSLMFTNIRVTLNMK